MSVCFKHELVVCSLCLLLTPDLLVDIIVNPVSNVARLYVRSGVSVSVLLQQSSSL